MDGVQSRNGLFGVPGFSQEATGQFALALCRLQTTVPCNLASGTIMH